MYIGGDINTVINIFGKEISFKSESEVEEKIKPSTDGTDGMAEHGFSSDFMNNSWG